VKKVINKPCTLHYYVEFDHPKCVQAIEHRADTKGLWINGKSIKIMRINKIPLDLNEPSKVVLVTFLESVENVTIGFICDMFSSYGNLEKVVIYKKKNIQALIEMDIVENSERLKKSCGNSDLLLTNGVRIKVQYTIKKFLIVNRNSSNEFDLRKGKGSLVQGSEKDERLYDSSVNLSDGNYSNKISVMKNSNVPGQEDCKKSLDSDLTTNITNITVNITNKNSQDLNIAAGNILSQSMDVNLLNKTDSNIWRTGPSHGNQLDCHQNANNFYPLNKSNRCLFSTPNKNSSNQEQSLFNALKTVPRGAKTSRDSLNLIVSNSELERSLNLSQTSANFVPRTQNVTEKLQFSQTFPEETQTFYETPRGVLLTNIASFVTHDMLFNLFSLYGNIETIDKNVSLAAASVVYQCPNQMQMALKNLSGSSMYGLPMIMDILDPKNNILQNGSLSKNYIGFKDQRFKIPGSKNFKNMNPPSPTLHLSNLPEGYSLENIKNILGSVAGPLGITHFNESNSMALACFDSIDAAIRIITTFHNYNILGRYLKVAFAKYRLNMINSKNMGLISNDQMNSSPLDSRRFNDFGNSTPFPGQGNVPMFGYQNNFMSFNNTCQNYMHGQQVPNEFGLEFSKNNNMNRSRNTSTKSDFTIESQHDPSLVHVGFLDSPRSRHKMSDPTNNAIEFSGSPGRNFFRLNIGGPKNEIISNSSMRHVHKEFSNSLRMKSSQIQEILFQNDLEKQLSDRDHSHLFTKTDSGYEFPLPDGDADEGSGTLSDLLFGCEEVDVDSFEKKLQETSKPDDQDQEEDGAKFIEKMMDYLDI
jgi:hypothetical protein